MVATVIVLMFIFFISAYLTMGMNFLFEEEPEWKNRFNTPPLVNLLIWPVIIFGPEKKPKKVKEIPVNEAHLTKFKEFTDFKKFTKMDDPLSKHLTATWDNMMKIAQNDNSKPHFEYEGGEADDLGPTNSFDVVARRVRNMAEAVAKRAERTDRKYEVTCGADGAYVVTYTFLINGTPHTKVVGRFVDYRSFHMSPLYKLVRRDLNKVFSPTHNRQIPMSKGFK